MTTEARRERIERAAISAMQGLLDADATRIADQAAKLIATAAVQYATLIDAVPEPTGRYDAEKAWQGKPEG